jgi:hypothetical protein
MKTLPRGRPPLYFYPKDYVSALALKISFKQYTWKNALRRDGLRLKFNQFVGISQWDGVNEYLIQSERGLLKLFSERGQPADPILHSGGIPTLATPRSISSFMPYIFLNPRSRKWLVAGSILISATVFYVHLLIAFLGPHKTIVSMPLVLTTLLAGPAITALTLFFHLHQKRL